MPYNELDRILGEIDGLIEEYMSGDVPLGIQDFCAGMKKAQEIIRKHMNGDWIPVEERLPEEHDSIFAKWKGTDKWSKAMFEKTSCDVNVTVEYDDGKRNTITSHTVDGKWALPNRIIKQKVIAWRPLPEPYRSERSNNHERK